MADPSQTAPAPPQAGDMVGQIAELRVTGNLMTLDAGLFCLVQQPGQLAAPRDGSGLPGVRVSLPPGAAADAERVRIRGLNEDGWLGLKGGAALVHIAGGPAQILVTVYQSPRHPPETAPRLKVVRLDEPEPAAARAQAVPAASPPTQASRPPPSGPIIAHVERVGDVGAEFGAWIGGINSKHSIEGFSVAAPAGIAAEDIEYQAVLGRGWLSPWVSAGKFCGSRGMALPLLGFNLRLRGAAAERYACSYVARFVDGAEVGPLPAGRACEAPSLAALEAFRIDLVERPARPAAPGSPAPPAPAGKKPAARKPAAPARKSAGPARKPAAPARKPAPPRRPGPTRKR